jgi:PPOX class probable F420-dependent enzyme
MNTIPESHRDLLDGPTCAVLTTVMPDGQPQTTPIWFNREGDCLLINTMKGFRKEKNMRTNPKVTLLIYDLKNPLHNIEIRGTVIDMSEAGAVEHLDHLTQIYYGKPDIKFFGGSVPAELQETHIPVRITIAPTRIRVEG